MGRRKKSEALKEFPFLPVPMADFILYNEQAIRKAVQDARAEMTLLSAAKLDGSAKGGRVSDRTAAAAIKGAAALPCVVLDNGATVKAPEKWLSVLDDVRQLAKGCNKPGLIYDIWDFRYKEQGLFFGETREKCLPVETMPGGVVSWIRFHVLSVARSKGLVSFSDADLMAACEAAAG
jgi:hypothetical protein